MYLRTITLLFVAMSLQYQAFGQEEKNTQYQFKVYSNFEYKLSKLEDVFNSDTYESRSLHFGHITPSFVISKPRMSHEIGISRLHIGQNSDRKEETLSDGSVIVEEGVKRTQFYLNIRYEYALNLVKIKKKHQLSIAASAEPYIQFDKSVPRTSVSFPNKFTAFGSKLHLIPRATFSLSDRLFLDVNAPIEIMDVYRLRNYTDNPTFTESQREYTDTRSEFLDSVLRFRVGLGFNL